MKDRKVYEILGPKKGWSTGKVDGLGPLGYAYDYDDARSFVKYEKERLARLYGKNRKKWPWPYNEVDFKIVGVSLAYLAGEAGLNYYDFDDPRDVFDQLIFLI